MNLLMIGNSFSMDVATYLHQIAESAGKDLNVYVLYIGGCPIERHLKNIRTGDKEYDFYENGLTLVKPGCDIFFGLNYKKYDYVTFQQVSGLSGVFESYLPELSELMVEVRKYTDAKFLLHQTWSYAKYFSNERYGSNPLDQDRMDKDIRESYVKVSTLTKTPYIIPSGEAVRKARLVFGDELNRDGFHLNERARTLTGYLLAYYFLGKDINPSSFRPCGFTYENPVAGPDEKELPTLMKIAKETLDENKEFNL